MIRLFRLLAVVLLMLGAGCRPGDGLVEKIADDKIELIAKTYIEQVSRGEFEAIERDLVDEVKGPQTRRALEEMKGMIPPGEPIRISLAGYHWSRSLSANSASYDLVYEYEYKVGICVWEFKLVKEETDRFRIKSFRVTPLEKSLKEAHQFALLEKGPMHWIFLMATIAVFVFITWSFVSCIRTPFKGRKWPWAIFISFGFVQFNFNWSTGALSYKLLYIALFGSGFASHGLYTPWVFTTSIPVGAILYWLRRSKLRRETIPPLPETSSMSPSSSA